jgi:hypothetical protein
MGSCAPYLRSMNRKRVTFFLWRRAVENLFLTPLFFLLPTTQVSSARVSTLTLVNPRTLVLFFFFSLCAQTAGLFGPGLPFDSFDSFFDSMKRRGVSFMEMLAMELKGEGKYLARGLAFTGVEYSEVECRLSPDQVRFFFSFLGFYISTHFL